MRKVSYKVSNNFSGQAMIKFANNPFRYHIIKVNKNMFRVNILLTDEINKIGQILIKKDHFNREQIVSIKFHRQVSCSSLSDFKLNTALMGVLKLRNIDINKIIHHGSKEALTNNLKNKLKLNKYKLIHDKKKIKQIKNKLNSIKDNN